MAIPGSSSLPVCCEHVASVSRHDDAALCVLANSSSVRLHPFLANYLAGGDDIAFPVPVGDTSGPEIFITKSAVSGTPPCLYLAPIGYVSQPKADKRAQSFVSAEVVRGGLGITAVYLPCDVLRDYFYRVPPADAPEKRRGLYGILSVVPNATPAEMRVAFKLRTLEMETAGAPRAQLAALERAFNVLAQDKQIPDDTLHECALLNISTIVLPCVPVSYLFFVSSLLRQYYC